MTQPGGCEDSSRPNLVSSMTTTIHPCIILTAEKLDLSKVDLSKLRVKQLKKILSENSASCDGCLEKADYVRRVKEVLGVKSEL